MQNTYEIIDELSNLNPPTSEFNNKLMLKALALLNNPQNQYKTIHIAAYLEETLDLAGFKVGKYSSPNIQIINECIALNKQLISDNDLVTIYLELKVSGT
jgi:folylpolyglutamate synthase/dihydropteroate synthase